MVNCCCLIRVNEGVNPVWGQRLLFPNINRTEYDKLWLAIYDAGMSMQGCEDFDSFFGSRGIARAGYNLGALLMMLLFVFVFSGCST